MNFPVLGSRDAAYIETLVAQYNLEPNDKTKLHRFIEVCVVYFFRAVALLNFP